MQDSAFSQRMILEKTPINPFRFMSDFQTFEVSLQLHSSRSKTSQFKKLLSSNVQDLRTAKLRNGHQIKKNTGYELGWSRN